MNTNDTNFSDLSRRAVLKLFTGTIISSLVGVGIGLANTISTPAMISQGAGALKTLLLFDLGTIFGFQVMPQGSSGLAFWLNYKEQPDQFNDYGNGIPTITMQFEKTALDLSKMSSTDMMESIEAFVKYAIKTCPVVEGDLLQERYKIAVKSRRGIGNVIIVHPDSYSKLDKVPENYHLVYVTSVHVPKNQAIVLYSGTMFYDKPIVMAVRSSKSESKQVDPEYIAQVDNWMLCLRDDFDKYCTIVKI